MSYGDGETDRSSNYREAVQGRYVVATGPPIMVSSGILEMNAF